MINWEAVKEVASAIGRLAGIAIVAVGLLSSTTGHAEAATVGWSA